jgi:hypothetical protein
MTKLGIPITPRLARVLDAGDVKSLHAILTDWSTAELCALHRDMHFAYEAAVIELDAQYRRDLKRSGFLPEDENLWQERRIGLLEMFTEIHEVLGFYLDKQPKGRVQ